jgi:uncharacterized membrane protein YoaK (UPF0700 family)
MPHPPMHSSMEPPRNHQARVWLTPVLMLALAAGVTDAFSFLRLGQVFTSAMTGNTALLGMAIGQGRVAAASRSLIALGGFVAGALAGGLGLDRGRGTRARMWPRLLLAEAVLLFGFFGFWAAGPGHAPDPFIVIAAIAMGLQSVAARDMNIPGIMTTFFTGTLTALIINLTGSPDRRVPSATARIDTARQVTAFLWYLLGAAAAAALVVHDATVVALLPAVAVTLALLTRHEVPPAGDARCATHSSDPQSG